MDNLDLNSDEIGKYFSNKNKNICMLFSYISLAVCGINYGSAILKAQLECQLTLCEAVFFFADSLVVEVVAILRLFVEIVCIRVVHVRPVSVNTF